jgi:DNA mismatch endonuclease (patch repair protein)
VAKTRSEMMAAIPQSSTLPERALAAALERLGCVVSCNQKVHGIRVDLVLPELRAVVLVDGCFWHGCPDHYVRPQGNPAYWAAKLAANVDRDRRQTQALRTAQWNVVRLWEHDIEQGVEAAALTVVARCEAGGAVGTDLRVRAAEPTTQRDADGRPLEVHHVIGLVDGVERWVLRRRQVPREPL